MDAAIAVRQHAYAPYSGFHVGAAILDEKGALHAGCNVENAAYPEGNCAEANVIGSMVAAGGKSIAVIAVVGGKDALEDCSPCGGCRQRIAEFADKDTRIILIGKDNSATRYSIAELLPASFSLDK